MKPIYIIKATGEMADIRGRNFHVIENSDEIPKYISAGWQCYLVTELKEVKTVKTFMVFENETISVGSDNELP